MVFRISELASDLSPASQEMHCERNRIKNINPTIFVHSAPALWRQVGTEVIRKAVESKVNELLQRLRFSDMEIAYFKCKILEIRKTWTNRLEEETKSISLRLAKIKDRLNRLTDAYLDQTLDKMMFQERKTTLLLDQKAAEENLTQLKDQNRSTPDQLEKFLELASDAWLSHELAFPEEKREMVSILTSNRSVLGKNIDMEPSIAFQEIANRSKNCSCGPYRTRTCHPLIANEVLYQMS